MSSSSRFTAPLQLLSLPSQISSAPRKTAGSVSSQSSASHDPSASASGAPSRHGSHASPMPSASSSFWAASGVSGHTSHTSGTRSLSASTIVSSTSSMRYTYAAPSPPDTRFTRGEPTITSASPQPSTSPAIATDAPNSP